MRVIAGTAKRLQLRTLDGLDTRPTTDRIKETLFNMIAPKVMGCNFLDLFSGSGAIGIEALSRGAAHGYFVEVNRTACACIQENLRKTKLEMSAKVLQMDVLDAIKILDGIKKFDYIFMDPPYNKGIEQVVLERLAERKLLDIEGTIIVEASKETDFSYLEQLGFRLIKRKEYKSNMHMFLGLEERKREC